MASQGRKVKAVKADGEPDPGVRITSVRFKNFKALKQCSVSLAQMNILVGPNNAGKSTVLSAFRLLEAGLRTANSRRPELITIGRERFWGYPMRPDTLDFSVENVHTDYIEDECFAEFRLSNGNRLRLLFTADRQCFLIGEMGSGSRPKSVKAFQKEFPLSVTTVPTLGPVEYKEELRQEATVRSNLQTHRASINFRSYWWYNKINFPAFQRLIEKSWPGMRVEPPEWDPYSKIVSLFVTEDRYTRELYWSGFGFQVWCQLLTHIERGQDSSVLVIDEPEIYLHPEVQRQLYGLLSDVKADVLVATHSAELIAEAEASQILVLDKGQRSAKRLKSTADIQSAFNLIGSGRNLALTQLARTRRLLFVEGEDFKLISRLARAVSSDELAEGRGLTIIPTGGFGAWQSLPDYVKGIEAALGLSVRSAVVLDSDYRHNDENAEVAARLLKTMDLVHFHPGKEIENYLLNASALERAIKLAANEQVRRGYPVGPLPDVRGLLMKIVERHRGDVATRRIGAWQHYERKRGSRKHETTLLAEGIAEFDTRWASAEQRLLLVPGKKVFKEVADAVRERCGVTLTPLKVASGFQLRFASPELTSLLETLNGFRRMPAPA